MTEPVRDIDDFFDRFKATFKGMLDDAYERGAAEENTRMIFKLQQMIGPPATASAPALEAAPLVQQPESGHEIPHMTDAEKDVLEAVSAALKAGNALFGGVLNYSSVTEQRLAGITVSLTNKGLIFCSNTGSYDVTALGRKALAQLK